MKKNKLFLIPLLSITATTLSVVPAFTSCSCNNDKPISEDYSLSVVTDKVETDIYYNGNIDKYLTDNKQYVTFELKLNQPFYVEWQNEVVSQIVGLPWIVPNQTHIIYGTDQYAEAIDIDENEIQLYPSADHQTFTLFVPYTIKDASYDVFAEDQTMFNVQFTAKFYKGTGAQFENNEMTAISKSFTSPEFTVVHKKEKFVNADKTANIKITQSDEPIKFTYDLHKDGYTLKKQQSSDSYGLEYKLPYEDEGPLFVRKTDGEYAPKISGNQLTFYISPTENLRRFNCRDHTGDLPALSPFEFNIHYTPGNITLRDWDFYQTWTLNYEETTGFVDFEDGQEKITKLYREESGEYSQKENFKFKLKTPLKENQEIHVYGMTNRGQNSTEGQPIEFDAGHSLENPLSFGTGDIGDDKIFTIPQIANCNNLEVQEQTLDIQYCIECVDWNEKGKTIWTQTFNGFQAIVHRGQK